MIIMTEEELIPLLKDRISNLITVRHRIRTAGIMESTMAEKIRPAFKIAEGVKIAYLPSCRGLDLCIKGSGTIREEVQSGVDLLVEKIRDLMGEYIYTEDDRELEEVLGELLVEKGETLATAESCTGGLLGGRITAVSGSSRYYPGGMVAYADEAKINQLGVPRETIKKFGAVSEQTAKAMAKGVMRVFGADIGVAITGIAGPTGGTDEKPVGTIFIGLAAPEKEIARKFLMGPDREINRERSVTTALDMVRRSLLGTL
jgi:nicotinamide-nucleotide amidase